MRRFALRAAALLATLLLASAGAAAAVDTTDTLMLEDPAISASHIAFRYADDLWIADRDGSNARRLTSDIGDERSPRFSADGRHIAFSAQYDGNTDVYAVSVTGGVPTRLTWHGGSDVVMGFSPEGDVLFASGRQAPIFGRPQLFTVPLDGGFPRKLPVPTVFDASYSPDGRFIAYVPGRPAYQQWKGYRGGTTTRIWLYDVASHEVVQIPQPEGRCNDGDPMWIGDQVYFLSDRAGEFNLFAYDVGSRSVTQLTDYDQFPILSASNGDGQIIFEQAGRLHRFDPARGEANPLRVGVAADLVETRPYFADASDQLRSASVAPGGKRVVIESRGEILTLPAEKGDPRNLTETTGVHEREPVWSPDGATIAYISDASGEYQLHLTPQDGRDESRALPLEGNGFYTDLSWSPDGEAIAYVDNGLGLYVLDVDSGEVTKVMAQPYYGPAQTVEYAWSPDSRWLAYVRNSQTYVQTVFLYERATGEATAITDGLSDAGQPAFDRGGKYLYLTASIDIGPLRAWFAQSTADFEASLRLYAVALASDTPSPLAPESDEVAVEAKKDDAEDGDDAKKDEDDADDEGDDEGEEADDDATRIDLDGIQDRIVELPVEAGGIGSVIAGPAGTVFYLRSDEMAGFSQLVGMPSLVRYSLEDREEKTWIEGVRAFDVGPKAEKLVVVTMSNSLRIVGVQSAPGGSSGQVGTLARARIRVEPRAEWPQIFHEAWRINRDYFYDPGMHGADWPAMRAKYEPFLPHLTTRRDLNRLIQWMCSELGVGHHNVFGGDDRHEPTTIPGGLLGADFTIENDRYRFAKVYQGLAWTPELRAPLTGPGVGVETGDYLFAVDGVELTASDNVHRHFEGTVGLQVELKVGPNADGSDARTVTVMPMQSDFSLRAHDWVRGNLERVEEATDGRVAYVWVPNTAGWGHTFFKRLFFPQAHKDAIIVDERYNGGGLFADYYIDILRRPPVSYWTMRYGGPMESPVGAIHGPKVMLIDENAGSGGDLLPWMFRRFELGTLIGKRTWGGLVGILGFPTLMDGGYVSAPNFAFWTEDEGYGIENVGVPPDIEVEQLPSEIIAGRDPQLERAIEEVLKKLEANPPTAPEMPPFPVRAPPAARGDR
ncbi:MAG: PDZ domain-containing protein [Acidobacteriota bacterium]